MNRPNALLLLAITALLAAIGCALYVGGLAGWAQLAWILASGTAGAGCALILDEGDR